MCIRDSYYARGHIDGQPEEFELSDVAPVLGTREALEKHFWPAAGVLCGDVQPRPHAGEAQRRVDTRASGS